MCGLVPRRIFGPPGPFSKIGVVICRSDDTISSMYPQYTEETRKQIKRIIESWASLQWKVLGHHFTRVDLIQEGWLIMERLVKKYPKREEPYMLSTLARSLQNKSRDLSKKPDRLPAVTDLSVQDNVLPPADHFDDEPDCDYPDWLQKAIEFAANADPRQLAAIASCRGDRYLAEKCGLPADFPVKKMVLRALA